jgi:hypothetical protein
MTDYEAENEKLRALLKAANERAEAQLPLPTELAPLKPAAFNAGVNNETARGWNLHRRVDRSPVRGRFEIGCQACKSSSSVLASFRSSVSKPSVNQQREDRGPYPACPDRARAALVLVGFLIAFAVLAC